MITEAMKRLKSAREQYGTARPLTFALFFNALFVVDFAFVCALIGQLSLGEPVGEWSGLTRESGQPTGMFFGAVVGALLGQAASFIYIDAAIRVLERERTRGAAGDERGDKE